MTEISERRMERLRQELQHDPSLAGRLPDREGEIVREAMEGKSVYDIAQDLRTTEADVWEVLGNAARAATGQPVQDVETGGLGSDTDPGVSGGYGDTAFGSLGNEPPFPTPEEPE